MDSKYLAKEYQQSWLYNSPYNSKELELLRWGRLINEKLERLEKRVERLEKFRARTNEGAPYHKPLSPGENID